MTDFVTDEDLTENEILWLSKYFGITLTCQLQRGRGGGKKLKSHGGGAKKCSYTNTSVSPTTITEFTDLSIDMLYEIVRKLPIPSVRALANANKNLTNLVRVVYMVRQIHDNKISYKDFSKPYIFASALLELFSKKINEKTKINSKLFIINTGNL